MAIPDPPKAGSPFCALWTGGWNPKTPKINNFFIPEITLRGGYEECWVGGGRAKFFFTHTRGKGVAVSLATRDSRNPVASAGVFRPMDRLSLVLAPRPYTSPGGL